MQTTCTHPYTRSLSHLTFMSLIHSKTISVEGAATVDRRHLWGEKGRVEEIEVKLCLYSSSFSPKTNCRHRGTVPTPEL